MNSPIRQHFIPRSYLNNFAKHEKPDKYFVFARRKEGVIKISTKDICVEKNLYTLPTNEQTKKFAIEKFYADNVDSVFPEVYRILTNDSLVSIDFETRLKIINTALSLYFRTPKFLNKQNKIFEDLVNYVKDITATDEIKLNYFGEDIVFSKSEAENLIKIRKEDNRILFLTEHLASYEKFVSNKLLDGICVYKIIDNSEFITCDNPVIVTPFTDPTSDKYTFEDNILRNPFDAENMIYLPLNAKYILAIMPKSANSNINDIQRMKIEIADTLMYNSSIEKNSEEWIIGNENSLKQHIEDQLKYNQETEENIMMFDDYKNKVVSMK